MSAGQALRHVYFKDLILNYHNSEHLGLESDKSGQQNLMCKKEFCYKLNKM